MIFSNLKITMYQIIRSVTFVWKHFACFFNDQELLSISKIMQSTTGSMLFVSVHPVLASSGRAVNYTRSILWHVFIMNFDISNIALQGAVGRWYVLHSSLWHFVHIDFTFSSGRWVWVITPIPQLWYSLFERSAWAPRGRQVFTDIRRYRWRV